MSSRYRRQSFHLNRSSRNYHHTKSHSWQDQNLSNFESNPFSHLLTTHPSIDSMKHIRGYEFVTFQPQIISPPNSESESEIIINSSDILDNISERNDSISSQNSDNDLMVKAFDLDRLPGNVAIRDINNAEARSALFQYVSNKFCYGTKAAAEMQIRDMNHSFVFEYSLESFTERRQLCWTFEPYRDALEPDPSLFQQERPIPKDAWSIDLNEFKSINQTINDQQNMRTSSISVSDDCGPELFQNNILHMPVPGTVSINSCHICCGSGRKKCNNCFGTGSKSCQTCTGHGFYGYKSTIGRSIDSSDFCFRCHGRGTERCNFCSGDGTISCPACVGTGQIKCYIRLMALLTNHQDSILIRDHLSEEIPLDLLNLADGDIVFEEKGKSQEPYCLNIFSNKMYQLNNEIDANIQHQSRRLIKQHRALYLKNSRLILQRHRIRMIPITKVLSSWKSHQFHFYVFGSCQHRCYTENYPQKLICDCCCIT